MKPENVPTEEWWLKRECGVTFTIPKPKFPDITFSIVIQKTPDVPGMWAAHCLENDIIGTGDSALGAYVNLFTCMSELFADDARRGRDFLKRTPAPAEYWEDFESRPIQEDCNASIQFTDGKASIRLRSPS